LAGRKTVVLSTHILPEVSSTCDHVVIIDRGKVVAADTVENLSQHLAGGKTLELEVKGPPSEVEKALAKVEGVANVKVMGKETPGSTKFEVTTDGTTESREEVFRCVVKNKWILTQMTPVGLSLEEVFLRLTTKESAA
jgi:ABC-2 type transport system ATP-binding protein